MRRAFVLVMTLVASLCLRAETFPNPRIIPTAPVPFGVHVADFNNDGRPDIVFTSLDYNGPYDAPRSADILLAQPDGTYQSLPPITLTATTRLDCNPIDVNADNKLDLVCSEFTTQIGGTTTYYYYARTLLGNGDGTFQAPIISSLGRGQAFAVNGTADFNHDNHVDLAVVLINASGGADNGILLGDGAGHFTVMSAPSVELTFSIGDANKDGWTDFLDPAGPFAFLNKGDGTFTYRTDPTVPFFGCTYGDMDNDGNLDAVCISRDTAPGINVIRGKGDGSFDTSHPVLTVPALLSDFQRPFKLLDLNHDGLLDMVAYSANGLTTFMAKGSLQFSDAVRYNLPGTNDQYSVQDLTDIADINGDGNYDIVSSGLDGIYITYGKADGTFDAVRNIGTSIPFTASASADFNNDGLVDLITFSDPDLYLWKNQGDGSIGDPQKMDVGALSFTVSTFFNPILPGDFNGDGKKDLIAYGLTSPGNAQPYLLQGKGDGTFATPTILSSTPADGAILNSNTVAADLNADGRDDLVRTDRNYLYARLSRADGTFAPQVTSSLTSQYTSASTPPFALADFDHDGKIDSAIAFQDIFFHRGKGDGTFAAGNPVTVPYDGPNPNHMVFDIKTGDFDGDDNPDLAILFVNRYAGTDLAIYYGDGTGKFSTPLHLQYSNPLSYNRITVSDLDGDGRSDLILTYDTSATQNFAISVVHALDNRSFGPITHSATSRNNPFLLLPTDFNRDGFNDLLVGASQNALTLLLNNPGPVVGRTLTVQPEPSAIGQSFTLSTRLTPPSGSTTLPTGTISFSIDRTPVGTADLSDGAAALPLSSQLSLGSHKVSAYWPGDSNYSSVIFSTTHTITLIPVTISFTGTPSTVTIGQTLPLSFSFANGVSSSSLPPTGTYTVSDGAAQIGSGTITATGSSFTINYTPLSAGTRSFSVSYSGDATHSASTANFSVTVAPAPTTTTLRSSANPAAYGGAITFTTTISPQVTAGTSELLTSGPGTLTLSGLLGGPVTLPVVFPSGTPANTPVVITYSPGANLAPGTYPVTATFSGNLNLLGSSATLSQVVTPPPSTTTLTISPSPSYAAHLLTLTAGVAGIISTPTGAVRIMDGSTLLATVALTNGNASFSTRNLTTGAHNFTATYAGDGNNAPSTATLSASILPYDFSLSPMPASTSLRRGSTASVTITANSIGAFAENISFSVTGQPADFAATIAPSTLQLTAGGNGTATLTIGNTSNANLRPRLAQPLAAASLMAVLLPFSLFRRRRSSSSLLGLVLAACLLATLAGCGGSSGPQSYTLQVTATSTDTSIAHTITVPVTITK
ncbi:MAG TPA: FG-GAP-like repeat-containing protein [Edaphobacter sp.]